MFYFPTYASEDMLPRFRDITLGEFPHSEISGSKVIRHLPETYRSLITSFIASLNQGIHLMLLFLIKKYIYHYTQYYSGTAASVIFILIVYSIFTFFCFIFLFILLYTIPNIFISNL